jgi:hypothetical protein
MRTRTRQIVNSKVSIPAFVNASGTHYNCDGSTTPILYNVAAEDIITDVIDECMRDEVGKNSTHPVRHRKRWSRTDPTSFGLFNAQDTVRGYYEVPSASQRWVRYKKSQTESAAFTAWDVSNVLNTVPPGWTIGSPTFSDEVMLKESVLEKARGIKADILLDIIEANQMAQFVVPFSQTIPTYRANWKTIRRRPGAVFSHPITGTIDFIRANGGRVKNLLIREARGLAKFASGSHLMYAFGIAPLVSDMIAVNKSLATMSRDVKRFVENDAMRYSSKAEHIASCSLPRINYNHPTNIGVYTSTAGVGRVVKAPNTRYVLVVRPHEKVVKEALSSLDYFLARYATSPASLAWELVPFSFVADWFVDLRGALRGIDKMLGFTPYVIQSFTRSYSYHIQTKIDATYNNTCNSAVLTAGDCGTVEFQHYERSLVTDRTYWPALKPQEGKNHAGIAASLITQMLLKKL